MRTRKRKLKVGIVGCGAIGSRIAKSIKSELKDECRLSGLFDIKTEKAKNLAHALLAKNVVKSSLNNLVKDCDLIVEAVNAPTTREIIKKALEAKKSVLAMSVGKLLNEGDLFRLAQKNGCFILLPSGAISGLDAVKAASLINISRITLTSRKPPQGFARSPHILAQGIDLDKITSATVLFEGDVDTAVKLFPENINVAATLALASQAKNKMLIRIITSPEFKTNSHEVEIVGDFGRMVSRTDNVTCPDNPKTSYLAVLSAIQTLKQFFHVIKIGT